MNGEYSRKWKEVVIAHVEVLSRRPKGESEENH
jgi:hypothetical protein